LPHGSSDKAEGKGRGGLSEVSRKLRYDQNTGTLLAEEAFASRRKNPNRIAFRRYYRRYWLFERDLADFAAE
ncbi:MAG TPA: hypothetical protein VFH43_07120, partial [Candidatus Kapabacteria bacterium]|nr:hypothetical protein [Candidatus Kapabacteria bacterium]